MNILDCAILNHKNDVATLTYLEMVSNPRNRTPGLESLSMNFLGSTSISSEGILTKVKDLLKRRNEWALKNCEKVAQKLNSLLGRLNLLSDAQKKELEQRRKKGVDPHAKSKLPVTAKGFRRVVDVIVLGTAMIGAYMALSDNKKVIATEAYTPAGVYGRAGGRGGKRAAVPARRAMKAQAKHEAIKSSTSKIKDEFDKKVEHIEETEPTKGATASDVTQAANKFVAQLKKIVTTVFSKAPASYGTMEKARHYATIALVIGGLITLCFYMFKPIKRMLGKLYRWAKGKFGK